MGRSSRPVVYQVDYDFGMEGQDPLFVFADDAKEARRKFWAYMRKQKEVYAGEDELWSAPWSDIKDELRVVSANRVRVGDSMDYKEYYFDPVQIKWVYDEAQVVEDFLAQ